MPDKLPQLLCRVNFPLYSVHCISPRHLLFAGGGGPAKTGVQNGFEIFELSHDGKQTKAESITRFVTKNEDNEFAVMNMASAKYNEDDKSVIIALGNEGMCQLYKLQLCRENKATFENLMNGNLKAKENTMDSLTSSRLVFDVSQIKSVQTDFTADSPYQKVVRISCDGNYMATGGEDGFLRVWTFKDLYRTHEIEAHEKEIDDLDFSPDSSKIVTIGKDGRSYVWDVRKGKKHAEMGWDHPKNTKYLFKRVRFGRIEGDNKRYKVFSISNPIGSSKYPSYLQRWDGKNFLLEQSLPSSGGSLSALAVSDNGNFVATGSMFDGTVEIFIAFNLEKLKRIERAHSTFVTGLEFLPTTEDTDVIRGFSDASVVSISVDNQVCIHHIPRQMKISIMLAGFILLTLLVGVFILCSYLGL